MSKKKEWICLIVGFLASPIFKLCKCRKTSQPLCHYIIKNVAVKVKMHVEDNLDSDIFYDFWQLSGCAVVLCRNMGHISKITTKFMHLVCICCRLFGHRILMHFSESLCANLFCQLAFRKCIACF